MQLGPQLKVNHSVKGTSWHVPSCYREFKSEMKDLNVDVFRRNLRFMADSEKY